MTRPTSDCREQVQAARDFEAELELALPQWPRGLEQAVHVEQQLSLLQLLMHTEVQRLEVCVCKTLSSSQVSDLGDFILL